MALVVAIDQREGRLRTALEPLRAAYDYIFIDCPPSLGLLTVNALVAADRVLVPLQCEYYALEGLGSLLRTIELVRARLNRALALEGVVLTMFDARNNLARQVAADVQGHLPGQVYQTVIPRNVRLSEAPSHGRPALLYDIESKGAQSYLALAEEMLARHAGEGGGRSDQRAGQREIPVLVREMAAPKAFEIALIENIQREDLNPVEEAEAYQRLQHEYGLTHDELATRLGKERSTVSNSLRL